MKIFFGIKLAFLILIGFLISIFLSYILLKLIFIFLKKILEPKG